MGWSRFVNMWMMMMMTIDELRVSAAADDDRWVKSE
jgi:hypothetical protein